MILKEIKNIKTDKEQIRQFGIIIGVVLLIIAATIFWTGIQGEWMYFTLGFFFIAIAAAFPNALRLFYVLWMSFAIVLGWLMSRLILLLLYYLVLSPIGLISRLIGKSFLELKIDLSKKSYWNSIENKKSTKDYERQF